MIARCRWCETLNALEDEEHYTLHDIRGFLADYGHEVEPQAIYRWITRRQNGRRA